MSINNDIGDFDVKVIDKELVNEVRKLFLADYEANSELYDERDVNRIRNNDAFVWRYIVSNRHCTFKVHVAVDVLIEGMRWKKSFGVHDRKDTDFPLQFHQIAMVFPYNCDCEGRKVVYLRMKLYLNITELDSISKQFIAQIEN